MSYDAVAQALDGHVSTGDSVFSLQRTKKRPFWQQFLDVVLSGGALGDLKDLTENVQTPWFLIGSSTAGTIVRVADGHVVEEIAVSPWNAAWKDGFRRVVVAGHEYRKVARVA
ncbi:MAG: hypothetical protein KDB60_04125 [Propionibacteriaceae bacterium]|nr:hypothetical protein [Propionibacteriaceae bacterium]